MNNGSFIKLSYLNCHSLTKNRRYYINQFLQDQDIDIMIAAETWLGTKEPKPFKRTIFDLRQPPNTYRVHAHEGIAAGCSPKLNNKIKILEQDQNKKWCIMKIDILIIATCYLNQKTTKNAIEFFWKRIEHYSDNANLPTIIMGDINAHFEDEANDITFNERGRFISRLMEANNWRKLEPSIGFYTSFSGNHQTITDHVIISPSAASFVEDFYLEEKPFDTNHVPLMVELFLPGNRRTPSFKRWNIRLRKEEKYSNHYKQLLDDKMECIQNKISTFKEIPYDPSAQETLDEIYQDILNAFQYAMEYAIGYFEAKERMNPFYHTQELEAAKEEVTRIKHRISEEKRNDSTPSAQSQSVLIKAKSKLKKLLRQASAKTFEKAAEEFNHTRNTGKFLKMVHSLKNRENRSNCMLDPDKIDIHAEYFLKSTFGLSPSGAITDREAIIHDMISLARSFNSDRKTSFEDAYLFRLISHLSNDKDPFLLQFNGSFFFKMQSRC